MMSPIKYLQTAEVKKLLTVITDPRDRALYRLQFEMIRFVRDNLEKVPNLFKD